MTAADRGARVVICTCSTLGPVADTASLLTARHIVRVDRPMVQRALGIGTRRTALTEMAGRGHLIFSIRYIIRQYDIALTKPRCRFVGWRARRPLDALPLSAAWLVCVDRKHPGRLAASEMSYQMGART